MIVNENRGAIKLASLRASILKDDYFEFFKEFWSATTKEKFIYNWHIEYIAKELETVGKWIINREPKEYDLLINVPPGSSKSTLCTILFPVWLWVNKPELVVISGSYDARLSISHASKSRSVIDSELFQKYFGYKVKVHPSFDAKTHYKTTEMGERIITSSGKSVIGSHAHVIIVDDPIDPKGVKSETVLATIEHWVEVVLPTRKVDKQNTPMIMIMQRLHESDPAGVWLSKIGEDRHIKHICLPASDEYDINPPELESNYIDGLLDPHRMPWVVLKEFKTKMGSIEHACQFGQSTSAAGGNIFTNEMLPIIKWHQLPDDFGRFVVNFTVDSADKEKKENDPTGILAYVSYEYPARIENGIQVVVKYLFLLDFVKIRARFSQRVKFIVDFVKKWGSANSMIYIEPASSGTAMYQYMKDTLHMNAVEWSMIEGDKVRRLSSITPFGEAHKIWAVEGAWNSEFRRIVTTFPNVKHDEEVDVLVMAAVNTFVRNEYSGYSLE